MSKFYIIFLILVLSASGLVYALQTGWYPLALVNGELVWQRDFQKEYDSATRYYNQALETYKVPGVDKEKIAQLQADLKRETLNNLVEKLIISGQFDSFVGSDSGQLVLDKVDEYLENEKLAAAAVSLFNLEFSDFVSLILVPQAQKEILQEKLQEESRDFDNWLKNEKMQAKIYLFTDEFIWNSETIERRG